MSERSRAALVDRLTDYDCLVEVGIGQDPRVARALAERGRAVTATDVVERSVPSGVTFVRDDVTDPTPAVYADADAIYALNLPPELHRPTWQCAKRHDAAFCFTTLGAEQPIIPVSRESLPLEPLFVADPAAPG